MWKLFTEKKTLFAVTLTAFLLFQLGIILNYNLFLAAVNADIGERQLNTLLADLNIPPVSHTTLLARQKKVGVAFKEMAKESTEKALHEEIN